ncbi:MAG: hypothetical protein AAGA02_06155 [Bacteroidota bacterium]
MNRKLDKIEKKNIYKVPDNYFDKLPGIIQSRAVNESRKSSIAWSIPVIKYAVPALLVVILAGYYAFFNGQEKSKSAVELLAEVETDQLVEYLAYSEITTEEILEIVEMDEIEFEFENEETDLLNDSDLGDLEYVLDEFLEINEL